MNVPISVRLRMGRIQHIALIKVLRALRTVFQHGAHGGVSVDVRIFTLNIAVRCVFICNVLKRFHQAVVHIAHACAFRTIEDICLCCADIAVFNQNFFNAVLDLFHCRRSYTFQFQAVRNLLRKPQASIRVLFSDSRLKRLLYRTGNFIDIEMDGTAIALFYACNHVNLSPLYFRTINPGTVPHFLVFSAKNTIYCLCKICKSIYIVFHIAGYVKRKKKKISRTGKARAPKRIE